MPVCGGILPAPATPTTTPLPLTRNRTDLFSSALCSALCIRHLVIFTPLAPWGELGRTLEWMVFPSVASRHARIGRRLCDVVVFMWFPHECSRVYMLFVCLFVFLLANGTCFSMVQCQKVQVLGTK